jgi:hypothetical protein
MMLTSRLQLYLGLILVGAFAAIQVVPVGRASNPPVRSERSIEAQLQPPKLVTRVLDAACRDCHSHRARFSWYSKVAPVSWVVADDVARARRAMNLSLWPAKPRLMTAKLIAACASLQAGSMPPPAYRWTHPEARLSKTDVEAFCQWTDAESVRMVEEIVRRASARAQVRLNH